MTVTDDPLDLPAEAVVLVTGANGFVGGRVCQRLDAAGVTTRALVRRAGTAPADLPHVAETVASWDDPDALRAAMDGVTHVIHCFATAGEDLAAVAAVNVDGTRAVADAAKAAGVTRLVHVSTTSVVAEDALLVDENSAVVDDAAGPYSVTKRDAEVVIREAQADGLDTAILRPPAVLGWAETSTWGQRVPAWVGAGELPWARDGRGSLGWVHVDDFADALTLALTAPAAVGRTYVIANGTTTWRDYIGTIRSWFADAPDPLVDGADAPPPRRWSSEAAAADLGWSPRRTFDEAMAEAAVHHG